MKILLQLLLCLLVITTCVMGQAARTGTLVGTVTDTTGAVIPNAKISVRNVETSFVTKSETNAEGAYYAPYLAVGSYELTVEAAGFKTYVQSGIQLRAAEVPRIDVKLDVGATSESVAVTASAPLLETETSQISQTVEHQAIEQLPVYADEGSPPPVLRGRVADSRRRRQRRGPVLGRPGLYPGRRQRQDVGPRFHRRYQHQRSAGPGCAGRSQGLHHRRTG